MMAAIALAGDGTPTGIARLGSPLNISVRWIQVSQHRCVSRLREVVTHHTGDVCRSGRMVDLAATTGGRLRYQWTQGNLASLADLSGVRVCRGAVNG